MESLSATLAPIKILQAAEGNLQTLGRSSTGKPYEKIWTNNNGEEYFLTLGREMMDQKYRRHLLNLR